MSSVNAMVSRLKAEYRESSPQDRREGNRWYREAHNLAHELVRLTNSKLSLEQAAGLIAVTSPTKSWKEQMATLPRIASALLNDGQVRFHTRRNEAKAKRIVEGDLSALSGPKVTNFYRAILGDSRAIVVDRHAFRAARGINNGTHDQPSPKQYDDVAEAYRRAAWEVGISPRDFQATVWVRQKRKSQKEEAR